MLPKDPYMLLSTVNTKLRDFHDSLEDFCTTYQYNQAEIEESLAKVDYHYDRQLNQFVS